MPKILPKKRKRRAWTAKEKLAVLEFYETANVALTLQKFGCSESQLFRWKDQEQQLLEQARGSKRLKGGGRPIISAELERKAIDHVENKRKEGLAVTGASLQRYMANQKDHDGKNINASSMWLERFKLRNSFTFREATSKTTSEIVDKEGARTAFLDQYNRAIKMLSQVNTSLIINMDEVSTTFDSPPKRTLETKGTKNVEIKTTNHEGDTTTVILAATAAGNKLPAFVILRGTRQDHKVSSRIKIPAGMVVVSQKKAWSTKEVVKLWIIWVLIPYIKSKGSDQKPILLLDLAPSHDNDDIKTALLAAGVTAFFIPAGCTSILQPLDVSINRSFKAKLRSKWEQWMNCAVKERTKSGKGYKRPYNAFLLRVQESWSEVETDVILNGWIEPGYITRNAPTTETKTYNENRQQKL